MLFSFKGLLHQDQIFILWLVPLILTFLLYTMIYFNNTAALFSYLTDLYKTDDVINILNKVSKNRLSDFKSNLPKYLSVILSSTIFIGALLGLFYLLINNPIVFLYVAILGIIVLSTYIIVKSGWMEHHKISLDLINGVRNLAILLWESTALLFTSRVIGLTVKENIFNLSNLGINNIVDILATESNYILAYIIVISDIIILIFLLYSGIRIIFYILSIPIDCFKDQILLYKLSSKIKKYNMFKEFDMSASEALNNLSLLKTYSAKSQYIQILIKWLFVDKNSLDLIIQKAIQSQGNIKDMLFYFAEMCENSIDTKLISVQSEVTNDADETIRWISAQALGKIGDMRAVEPLIQILNYTNVTIRASSAEALDKIGDKKTVELLIEKLNNVDETVRWVSAEALGKIGDKKAVELLIQKLNDTNATVRRFLAEVLGKIGDTRAIEPLIQKLNDTNTTVRRFSVEALGNIGNNEAVEPLIEKLNDTNVSRPVNNSSF
jgi:hypothetical protein